MSQAEDYFLSQLAAVIGDETVRATAYFRTFMKDRSGGDGVGDLIGGLRDASRARGYFLALTASAIHFVETRAPGTSTPLLENTGTASIALADISRVTMTHELLLIESTTNTLPLQMVTKNKAFPLQGALINALAAHFDLPHTAKSVQRARRGKHLRTIGLIAVGSAIAFAWAAFQNR